MDPDNPDDPNFDSDEELDNAIKDALNQLENRFPRWRTVQTAIDNIDECNMDMDDKAMELHRNIEAMGTQANLRQDLNETLREQLKHLKEEHARMTAYKNKSHGELVSDFAAEFAKHRILAYLHSQETQPPQPQPPMAMAPSTSSAQPPADEQTSGPESSINPKN